jgi:hypothetical protein
VALRWRFFADEPEGLPGEFSVLFPPSFSDFRVRVPWVGISGLRVSHRDDLTPR